MLYFKKKLWLLVIFFLFITFNFLFITKLFVNLRSRVMREKILSELSVGSNPTNPSTTTPMVFDSSSGNAASSDKILTLKKFFRKYDSPLYEYAEYIVDISQRNSLDFRLIPAIAMQESGLCKNIPKNSFNCWGWGINSSGTVRFASYDEAIDTIARGLKKNYIDRGLVTPEDIMVKYAPHSDGSWAFAINHFFKFLE